MKWNFVPRLLASLVVLGFCATVATSPVTAQNNPTPQADAPWTEPFVLPTCFRTNQLAPEMFKDVRAQAIAGRIRVTWRPGALNTNASVAVWASCEDARHWPVRDWHSYPLDAHGAVWDNPVPVDSVDLPLIYFIASIENGKTNLSLMRVCQPRVAGIADPTRVFWPFLEGFEISTEGWWLVDEKPDWTGVRKVAGGHTGNGSLRVEIPARRAAVAVATTRVRGWQIVEHGAKGLRLWLRTESGNAKARFTLISHAGNDRQTLAPCSLGFDLTPQWQRIDLPFDSFPGIDLAEIDLFTIEFVSTESKAFLVDDLQLIGRWKLEIE